MHEQDHALKTIAFDWTGARAVLMTAETGSLSAAARALGLTQPTLGRQVAAIEAELGVTLFERIGRRLIMTSTCHDLLPHLRTMADGARGLALSAAARGASEDGLVRISASDIYATWVLPPIVARLRTDAPGLKIDLLAANTLSDLLRREADIALRHVRPREPDLIARLIREDSARIYAATEWLDRNGRPDTSADLAGAPFVSVADEAEMLAHLSGMGLPLTAANLVVSSTHGPTALMLAQAGAGCLVMLDTIASQIPGIEPVLPELSMTVPLWLVAHREVQTSRPVRRLFDHLVAELT
jgi:DNA-binding transcriptional LysR family regulator